MEPSVVLLRGPWLTDQKSGVKVACRQSHLLQRLPILRKVLWDLRRSACDSCRGASRSPASSLRFALPDPLPGFLPSELLFRPCLGHRSGGLRLHLLALSGPTQEGRDSGSLATAEVAPRKRACLHSARGNRVALLFAAWWKPSLHLWFRTYANSAAGPLVNTTQASRPGEQRRS